MFQHFLRCPLGWAILAGFLFGMLFPLGAVALMLLAEDLAFNWDNLTHLHSIHYDLYIVWSAPLVLGTLGGLIGYIAQLLKQKMDALEYRGVQLNTLLDSVPSALITIDKFGTIMSFNQAAERMFGFTLSDVVGQNVRCLMPADVADEHDSYIARYLTTGMPVIMGQRREVQAKRKSGEVFAAMLQVNCMHIEGETFFSGVVDDISETKMLQAQLSQAQKLEAIGQLSAGVAHEINTPVQYIGDNLSALSDYFADFKAYQQAAAEWIDLENPVHDRILELTERYDLEFILDDCPKAIEQAKEGVERVSEIVKAMKSLSHVEGDKDKQIADLHEVLTNALILCRNSYKYCAEIETHFSPEVGYIECFPSELSQVFLNLIINASHAIEEKKQSRGVIRIETRKKDRFVEICIQDNGNGIPETIKDKVFNLFFTTKPVGKGIGQGLSLAHTIIVKNHGGRLYFESEAGKGTEFYIHLPV